MSEFTEKFEEAGDLVICTRHYPLLGGGRCRVEIFLTRSYVEGSDRETLKAYLDRAAAAILTRNGVEDAD